MGLSSSSSSSGKFTAVISRTNRLLRAHLATYGCEGLVAGQLEQQAAAAAAGRQQQRQGKQQPAQQQQLVSHRGNTVQSIRNILISDKMLVSSMHATA